MFVISMKMTRTKVVTALSVLLIAGLFCAYLLSAKDLSMTTAKNSGSKITDLTAENNAQRIKYLQQFGWEVSNEPSEVVEIAIPTEFNDVYENYNILQKKQGFDLTPYRGKSVKRWTYDLKNHPDQQENVKANLLVYENKIIGGDICSLALDGFMHGFKLE